MTDETIQSAGEGSSNTASSSINPAEQQNYAQQVEEGVSSRIERLRAREVEIRRQQEEFNPHNERTKADIMGPMFEARPMPGIEFLKREAVTIQGEPTGREDIGAAAVGLDLEKALAFLAAEEERVGTAEQTFRSGQVAFINLNLQTGGFGAAEKQATEQTEANKAAAEAQWWQAYHEEELFRASLITNMDIGTKRYRTPVEEVASGEVYMADWTMPGMPAPYYGAGRSGEGKIAWILGRTQTPTWVPANVAIESAERMAAPTLEKQAQVQDVVGQLSQYIESINPKGKGAGFNPEQVAPGQNVAAYRQQVENIFAEGGYSPWYQGQIENYFGLAGQYETGLFTLYRAPKQIDYWSGRLQELNPEMPPELTKRIATERFLPEPTGVELYLFETAAKGGLGGNFLKTVQAEQPWQLTIPKAPVSSEFAAVNVPGTTVVYSPWTEKEPGVQYSANELMLGKFGPGGKRIPYGKEGTYHPEILNPEYTVWESEQGAWLKVMKYGNVRAGGSAASYGWLTEQQTAAEVTAGGPPLVMPEASVETAQGGVGVFPGEWIARSEPAQSELGISPTPSEEFKFPTDFLGAAGMVMGGAKRYADWAGNTIVKTIQLGDISINEKQTPIGIFTGGNMEYGATVGEQRAARNLIIAQGVKAEIAAPIAYVVTPVLLPAMGQQIIQDPLGFIPSTLTGLKEGLTTEPGFTIGTLYGTAKGSEAILGPVTRAGYETIQPRIAELKILLKTPLAEWKPTHAAINIFQTVKGMEIEGASTPDLAMVKSIGPENAPVVEAALTKQPHAIFGRATEIGQMPPKWIETEGYTFDLDTLMTKASEAEFTAEVGGKGVFDIHPFPEKYPVGAPEPSEGYAPKPAINPLPKTRADLLFTKTDPFAAVEIKLRGEIGLFSRESAVLQRPSGEIVPIETVRKLGQVEVTTETGPGLIDWHTHPADLTARLDAFLPPGEPVPVGEIINKPSLQDISVYAATNVKEGRIVTPDETIVIRPGKGGWESGGMIEGTIEHLKPTLEAETKTGLVSEKLRVQTQRSVASILGEETGEGGWRIGPPEHRLKDVYKTMRYGSFFAEQERTAGGMVSLWKAGRLENAVLSLQDYYGNLANLEGRYLPQDVAIYGEAIREFQLGAPGGGISEESISLIRARPDIGEPIFTPPQGYRYPTETGYIDYGGGSPVLVPSPSPSPQIRGPSPLISISLFKSVSPSTSMMLSSFDTSVPPSRPPYHPLSVPSLIDISYQPPYQPPSRSPPYQPPFYSPTSPPYQPPSRSPPYSPPVRSPSYRPPSSPPVRVPPITPPGTTPFIQPRTEHEIHHLAEELYIHGEREPNPVATFEETFTRVSRPARTGVFQYSNLLNIRSGEQDLLPPLIAPERVRVERVRKIELPTAEGMRGTSRIRPGASAKKWFAPITFSGTVAQAKKLEGDLLGKPPRRGRQRRGLL